MSGKQCISFWSIFQTVGKVEGKYLQANVYRVRFGNKYENKHLSNVNVDFIYFCVFCHQVPDLDYSLLYFEFCVQICPRQ